MSSELWRNTRRLSAALILGTAQIAEAQRIPDLGYMFPPGGRAGATIDVQLGGYDWTPDMECIVLDPRVRLTPLGPPGELLIPPPPYWFGPKSKIVALPIPREMPARLTIPQDMPPGPVRWQAANANGGTATGIFIVGSGNEAVELDVQAGVQALPELPATVSGRLSKIEEVDTYRIAVSQPGLVTCELAARQFGSNFHGVIEVRDARGRLLADVIDTEGEDAALTFAAPEAGDYDIRIRDIDHAGDRSFVYRLTVTPGPRVLAAIPAAGRPGETKSIEFVGIGVATGALKLESVTRDVAFPATSAMTNWDYRLQTPFGTTPDFPLLFTELPEIADAPRTDDLPRTVTVPSGITGALDRPFAEDRYAVAGKKGDLWSVHASSRKAGLPLDLALTVFSLEGKQLAQIDDLPGTTDAGLDFTVPTDGVYHIVVSDQSGQTGARDAVYRLTIQPPAADFRLQTLQRVNLLIGEKTELAVKAVRTGGFAGPIHLALPGLPAGVRPTVGVIAADKTELKIPLEVDAGAISSSVLGTLTGTATIGEASVSRTARCPAAGNLIVHSPHEHDVSQMLVTTMMRPRFKGRPVDQDTGRKVHRGSTFPADVTLERLEGYTGEILLRMAARQSYQVQGITGFDVLVPPGVERTIYPCYMPEWLETSRTSRMAMIGEVQIPDPTGRRRHQVVELTGMVTMTMEGALLKISSPARDLAARPGAPIEVPLKISRSSKLPEPAKIELRLAQSQQGLFFATPLTVSAEVGETTFRVTPALDAPLTGPQSLVIRATVLQNGDLPAISETTVEVEFPKK